MRRLAFVVDTPDWAFDTIAKNVGRILDKHYAVERIYVRQHKDIFEFFHKIFVEEQFDNIHFTPRETLFRLLRSDVGLARLAQSGGLTPVDLAAALARPVVTFTVYDHMFSKPEEMTERGSLFAFADGYSTSSPTLYDHYTATLKPGPVCVTDDGVDLDLFRPMKLERLSDTSRPLTVGWAGNSKWGANKSGADPKGVDSVIAPAIEALQSEGLDIVGHFADRNVVWRPLEDMPSYYAQIDLLVCASEAEGTPFPVLEAMACGVPVISTDVGIVRQALGPTQREFILAERTPEALARKLRILHADRTLLARLSAENLTSIRGWSWETKVPKWLRLFGAAEGRHSANAGYKRLALERIATAQAQAERLQAQAKDLRAETGKRKAQIERLETENQKRQAEIRQLEAKNQELRTLAEGLRETAEARKQKLKRRRELKRARRASRLSRR
jgi:glycosyltransferase involved in cell wall biosynthesis